MRKRRAQKRLIQESLSINTGGYSWSLFDPLMNSLHSSWVPSSIFSSLATTCYERGGENERIFCTAEQASELVCLVRQLVQTRQNREHPDPTDRVDMGGWARMAGAAGRYNRWKKEVMSFSVRFSSVTNAKMEDKTRRQREAERVRGRPSGGRVERPLAAQARVRVYDKAGGRG